MKRIAAVFALMLTASAGFSAPAPPVFRLHLINEPTSLSPLTQRTSTSGYFLSQLACPLLRWRNQKLEPFAGECRQTHPTQIKCRVREGLTFQDGRKVEASHFELSFRAFLDPQKPAPRAEILYGIKNAEAVIKGLKKPFELGLQSKGAELTIDLEREDSEFMLTLANSLLTALPSVAVPARSDWKNYVSCGPYQMSAWDNGRFLEMAPREFPGLKKDRPHLRFSFVAEDSLALQSYTKGELDFLRRLPTLYFPQWKSKPDYRAFTQVRFDYLALAPEFRDIPGLASALARSIDYEAWMKLYDAAPRPGCAGLPSAWTGEPICWDYAPEQAREDWNKIKDRPELKKLRLVYSKQGGDDHERTVEFLQSQWKKNLGADVRVEGLENKIFLDQLGERKAPLFRKGLAPERASCRAVLENFVTDAAENYPHLAIPELDQIVAELRVSKKSRVELCRKGTRLLLEKGGLIPTGPIRFSTLIQPGWRGVELNELNQLDLTELRSSP